MKSRAFGKSPAEALVRRLRLGNNQTMVCKRLITLFLLAGCQLAISRTEEFNQVRVGMSKQDVIETLGSPSWSERKEGEDLWIYFLDPQDRSKEKIVYFADGMVVGKGDRKTPAITAEEADALKEPRSTPYRHTPSLSEKELRESIKKEVEKQNPKPKYKFEKL